MTFTLEQVGWNVTQPIAAQHLAECEMLLYCRRLSRWLAPSTASSVIHLLTLKIKHYLLVFDMACMQASPCFNLFHSDLSPPYHTYLEIQLLNGHDVLFAKICFGFIPSVLCLAPTVTTWSEILTAWCSTSRIANLLLLLQAVRHDLTNNLALLCSKWSVSGEMCFVYYIALKVREWESSSVWVRQRHHTKPTLSPPPCLTVVPAQVRRNADYIGSSC